MNQEILTGFKNCVQAREKGIQQKVNFTIDSIGFPVMFYTRRYHF